MIKRTIEISDRAAHLSVRRGQLLIQHQNEIVGQVPCEDLGVLVIDHPGTTYTHSALTSVANSGAALVLCGQDHLPQSILLPLADHTQVVSRLNLQINASKPTQKRLWKSIIVAKINGQAANLQEGSSERKRLEELAKEVKSGDTTNREGQAAKIYWKAWLSNHVDDGNPFRRMRDGVAPNNLLNYGYAIMRAALGRAVVAAGLQPALGIQHSHRANSFCLVDDLIEPLRPWVDLIVRDLFRGGHSEIDRYTKQAVLEMLTVRCQMDDQIGPLMVMLHRYVASFVKSLETGSNQLKIPLLCNSMDTETCG